MVKIIFLYLGGDKVVVTQGTYESGSNKNKARSANESRNNGSGRKFSKPNGNHSGGGAKPNRFEGGRPNRPDRPERSDRSRGYNSAPRFSGKDEDDEDNSRRSRPSKPKESKPSVAIPDKNKTMLRLEKEQKSIKKKQQTKKKESNRPQPKVKRANNVNYTRNYANGDYDDYDEYYDF